MLYSIKNRFYIDKIGNAYNQKLPKNFIFKGESHLFLEAMLVCSGSVRVTKDEKVYTLNAGDICFFSSMEFHCVKSYANTSPHIRNLSFTATGNIPSKIFDGVYHLSTEQQQQFVKCFNLVDEYALNSKNQKYLGQYILSNFSLLLIDISTESKAQDAVTCEAAAQLYKQIVVDMQESVYKNLSLYELANNSNISVSYLKKLFMRYAATSPKTFYNSLRVSQAAHLIDEGVSVATVAEKMNFSSPNYFSLFFKRYLGCTPTEYKKQ